MLMTNGSHVLFSIYGLPYLLPFLMHILRSALQLAITYCKERDTVLDLTD